MHINSIKIEDFLSIKELEFSFEQGLTLFLGENGAGKTSILQAISVGLYNKCERDGPLARLGGTGGFIITIVLIDNDNNTIKVVNNRKRNRFEVFKNGELLTHQISKGIPLIEQMFNMSYKEFTMLSFLSTSTISNILVGTDNNLIHKFFNLAELDRYEKVIKEERRIINKEKKLLKDMIYRESPVIIDKEVLISQQTTLNEQLSNLNIQETELYSTGKDIKEMSNTLFKLEHELTSTNKKLALLSENSTCPTCGAAFDDSNQEVVSSIIQLRTTKRELEGEIKEIEANIGNLTVEYNGKSNKIKEEKDHILNELHEIRVKLTSAEVIEEQNSQNLSESIKLLDEIEWKASAITVAMDNLRGGEVPKLYLNTFVYSLNSELNNTRVELDVKFIVKAVIGTKGLSFEIYDNGLKKDSGMLSAGERVIVGLMVLKSLLTTLRQTLNIHIPIILFDEAVSAVGGSNLEVISKLLTYIAEDRCVIATQHHDEVPSELFDSVYMIKKNKVTTIERI